MSESPQDCYVFSLRKGAKAHFINSHFPKLTLCGWKWSLNAGAQRSCNTEPLSLFGPVEVCSKCVHTKNDWNEQHDSEDSGVSELSSESSSSS